MIPTIEGPKNAPKARMYLGFGDMRRAVRIHHSLKVWPPPHSNTLSDLKVASMLYLLMGGELCCTSSTFWTLRIFLKTCRKRTVPQILLLADTEHIYAKVHAEYLISILWWKITINQNTSNIHLHEYFNVKYMGKDSCTISKESMPVCISHLQTCDSINVQIINHATVSTGLCLKYRFAIICLK